MGKEKVKNIGKDLGWSTESWSPEPPRPEALLS